jgi:hypothetical protein
MLLIATKIVPKNVLFTFAVLANVLELLFTEIGHLSRQNVLKTFWRFRKLWLRLNHWLRLNLWLRLNNGTGRHNRTIPGLLRNRWKVSIIVSASNRLL